MSAGILLMSLLGRKSNGAVLLHEQFEMQWLSSLGNPERVCGCSVED